MAKPSQADSSLSIPHAYTTVQSIPSMDDISLPLGPPRRLLKRRAIHDARDQQTLPIEAASAIRSDRQPDEGEKRLILTSLSRLFVLNHIDAECRKEIADGMKCYELQEGDFVFRQGQPSARFFVVAKGAVESLMHSKHLHRIEAGDHFGEIALLHDMPRTFSVRATEPTTLWAIDRLTVRKIIEDFQTQQHQRRVEAVQRVPLFSALSPKQIDAIAQSLVAQSYSPGAIISAEGMADGTIFAVTFGEISCTIAHTEVRRIAAGGCFGEESLLYGHEGSPRLQAITSVYCLLISVFDLMRVLGDSLLALVHSTVISQALQRTSAFRSLSSDHISKLVSSMKKTTWRHGDAVTWSESQPSLSVAVLLKGRLSAGRELITAPQFIDGSVDFLNASLAAVADGTEVAEWPKHVFELCTCSNLQQSETEEFLWFLRKVPFFGTVATEYLTAMAAVRLEGDEETDLFFVKSGLVEVLKGGKVIRLVAKYDFFGERSVIGAPRRTASVRARANTTCLFLNKSEIPLEALITVQSSMRIRIHIQDTNVSLSSLKPVRLIGKGMFGAVVLAKDENSEKLYALKTVSRRKVLRYRLSSSLRSEREALSLASHPMICQHFGSFKDEQQVCFLLEYINGVDLFTGIREIGILGDSDAKFYCGCLLLALEYLHDRDVLFRDLKPENVMLDEDGYPKLVDFGSSKWTTGRAYTVAGTPHYMAPEVILGKGYGPPADYWSLGVMLYEFLCGIVPFGEELSDPYDIYEEVLQGSLTYPSFMESNFPAQSLIEQLLSRNPSTRLGGTVSMLKQHPWLRTVPWQALLCREISPPFVPGPQSVEEEDIPSFLATDDDTDEEFPGQSPPDPDWDCDF